MIYIEGLKGTCKMVPLNSRMQIRIYNCRYAEPLRQRHCYPLSAKYLVADTALHGIQNSAAADDDDG